MAKDKKSFLIYCDTIHNIDHLTNEEKGVLFQHLLEYVNDMNPVLSDRVIISAWKPIERQLKRDLKKYEERRLKNSENARKRWNAIACDRMQMSAKHADNDIDTVNDKVIGSNKLEELRIRFLEKYPKGANPIEIMSALQQLLPEDQEKAIAHIPKYVSNTEKKFIKSAVNYLKSFCWNDKIEISSNNIGVPVIKKKAIN